MIDQQDLKVYLLYWTQNIYIFVIIIRVCKQKHNPDIIILLIHPGEMLYLMIILWMVPGAVFKMHIYRLFKMLIIILISETTHYVMMKKNVNEKIRFLHYLFYNLRDTFNLIIFLLFAFVMAERGSLVLVINLTTSLLFHLSCLPCQIN